MLLAPLLFAVCRQGMPLGDALVKECAADFGIARLGMQDWHYVVRQSPESTNVPDGWQAINTIAT